METQTTNLSRDHLKKWYKETKKWAEEFNFYMDELSELKRSVNSKKVKDHIEVQVQKNISIITSSTQDRLLQSFSDNLVKHKEQLSQIIAAHNTIELQCCKAQHKTVKQESKRLKRKIKSLKQRISDFLNKEPHVQRHGFSY